MEKSILNYDTHSPIQCSSISPEDKITERKVESFEVSQLSIFDSIK